MRTNQGVKKSSLLYSPVFDDSEEQTQKVESFLGDWGRLDPNLKNLLTNKKISDLTPIIPFDGFRSMLTKYASPSRVYEKRWWNSWTAYKFKVKATNTQKWQWTQMIIGPTCSPTGHRYKIAMKPSELHAQWNPVVQYPGGRDIATQIKINEGKLAGLTAETGLKLRENKNIDHQMLGSGNAGWFKLYREIELADGEDYYFLTNGDIYYITKSIGPNFCEYFIAEQFLAVEWYNPFILYAAATPPPGANCKTGGSSQMIGQQYRIGYNGKPSRAWMTNDLTLKDPNKYKVS